MPLESQYSLQAKVVGGLKRLESGFSKQIAQPCLSQPFPIRPYGPHQDRLFKHITFFEDDPNIKVRVSATDINYRKESPVAQKRVLLETSDVPEGKIRIQAVLSQSDYGVDRSYWVEQKHLDYSQVQSYNQYRMKGISKESWNSDWVYSEARNDQNDLVVYNMIHDILDLLLTAHDDQIDYVMDYITSDVFISVIKEILPEFSTSLDPNELKKFSLQEIMNIALSKSHSSVEEEKVSTMGEVFALLSNELKVDFKEKLNVSSQELSEISRTYRLIDQLSDQKKDYWNLLIEKFIEDRLEKVIQNTDIEVFFQNDEEMGVYLKGNYEFDIKSELIKAVCSASPDDRFVTKLDDAVKLVTEPVIVEELLYGKDETVQQFIRMSLTELYAPMLAVERSFVDLEHELEDRHGIDFTGGIIEFVQLFDDYEIRHLFVKDALDALIKGDLELKHQYQVDFIDCLLNSFVDSKMALFIDYHFDEIVNVFMNIGESFQYQYAQINKEKNEHHVVEFIERIDQNSNMNKKFTESKSLKTLDSVQHYETMTNREPYKEVFSTKMSEFHQIFDVKETSTANELLSTSMIEKVSSLFSLFKKEFSEKIKSSLLDAIMLNHTQHTQMNEEKYLFLLADEVKNHHLLDQFINHENLQFHLSDEALMKKISTYRSLEESMFSVFSDEVENDHLLVKSIQSHLFNLVFNDYVDFYDITGYITQEEFMNIISEDIYCNVFKHYLREPNKFPYIEKKDIELYPYLEDKWSIDGEDNVQYAVGDIGEGWPLGVFKLGVNTL